MITALKRILQSATKDENIVAYHVGPYVVMLIGAVVTAFIPLVSTIPPDSPYGGAGHYYAGTYNSISFWVWVWLSILCPVMVMASYWLPTQVHDSRYFSILLRLGGDLGQLFVLASLEFSTIKIANDGAVYRHILFYGYVIFILTMLVRDGFLVVATERLAMKMERDKRPEGRL